MLLDSKIVLITALSLVAIILSSVTLSQIPSLNTRIIQVDYLGYSDFKELAESSKVIVTGTVESLKSTTGTSTEIPNTTFEVKVDGISKLSSEGETISYMVQ